MALAENFRTLDELLDSGRAFTPNQVPPATHHALVFYIQAKEYEAKKNHREATIILQRLIRDWPHFAAPRVSLSVHLTAQGQHKEALKQLRLALRANPTSTDIKIRITNAR